MNKVLILIIIIISFGLYSSLFYPLLNTDHAVTILMISDFKIPDSLYFWGQDRMGSLIPLIGFLFQKVFHTSSLWTESIIHYAILIVGYFSFATFIKSKAIKIIFAIIWFLPPMRMIDFLELSFGIHYSILGVACYLINYYYQNNIRNEKRHLILFSIAILFVTSVWVSDLAVISFFSLIFSFTFRWIINYKAIKLKTKILEFSYFILGVIGCYFFIHYCKITALVKNNYSTIGDIKTIFGSFSIFIKTLVDFLIFRTDEPITSIYFYLIIFCVIYIFKKIDKSTIIIIFKNPFFIFLILETVLMFSAVISTKWTYMNNVPRRYFTYTYITIAIMILLILDDLILNNKINSKIILSLIAPTVLIGSLGTIYNLQFVYPKRLKSKVSYVREIEKLGEIGIIADYWNAYINSVTNPKNIKSTPYDLPWGVRNPKLVEEVFKQKKLYLIKDMWFEIYPDTIQQFGRVLIKDGDEFFLGDCNFCEYKTIK